MTEERLQTLSVDELHLVAEKYSIPDFDDLSRSELISLLLEIMEDDKSDRNSDNNSIISIEKKKYDIFRDEEIDFEDVSQFELPAYYNETELTFMLRDPSWAFAFWNISPKELDEYQKSSDFEELFFRVYELNSEIYNSSNIIDYYDIPLSLKDTSRYINLPHAEMFYCLDLKIRFEESEKLILRSDVLFSPKDTFKSEEGEDLNKIKKILKLSGLYSSSVSSFGISSFGEGPDGRRIPQRIISFADVQTFRPKG
ncbi:DUF4912 domain-containing protein [Spirochaeta cellobiosiphila]|uniref:DUF4912 domain-containing protein n=1 Tax=Spirochaeta cellobiosiphila TaxID=504483 RepID=UPI00040AC38A|nr:DUF4912 domain-containing protein [Spirochaeta cellobiosiphila]